MRRPTTELLPPTEVDSEAAVEVAAVDEAARSTPEVGLEDILKTALANIWSTIIAEGSRLTEVKDEEAEGRSSSLEGVAEAWLEV